MAGLATYWNTIRHLKAAQVYGRLRFRLARPRVDTGPRPPVRALGDGRWVPGAERPPSLLGPGRLRFLNETRQLDERGWDEPSVAKLWRYNLHYFDDLNARDAAARTSWHRELLSRWVRENPPPVGTGWEPYPTSLRIVNWIKWALRGNPLPDECVDSLAVQARWLSRRIEAHLLGNHLFANAKALVMAGLYFDGPAAAAWLDRGMKILAREIPEQILADGGQFERSTMYHALALEDLLDLCNVAATYPAAIPSSWKPTVGRWRELVGPMGQWLAAMSHPDGDISFFNDAAMKVAPRGAELDAYAGRLGVPAAMYPRRSLSLLEASGYIRAELGPAVVIMDVGPVGPDYLPAHAHADTLSFELSVYGRRLLVNSGTSHYEADAERLRQRGTAAHNTVVVDGVDSSEVWAGFRVARRARTTGLEATDGGGTVRVQCAHDGYRRLAGRPIHKRCWSLDGTSLIVTDTLSGTFRGAQARFHLHPAIAARQLVGSVRETDLTLPGGHVIRFSVDGGTLRQEPATWHPEFGLAEPNACLAVDLVGPTLRTEVRWDPPA